jgi:Protein of unknown function (DUF1353)
MKTRRCVLRTARAYAIGSIVTLWYADAIAGDQVDEIHQKDLVKNWMDAWMSASKAAGGVLWLGRFLDPMYFLTRTITWTPNNEEQASQLPTVHIPVGFVTDLASIPPPFYSLLRPDGNYAWAAVVHDFLYWEQKISREKADSILKIAMQDLRVDDATVSVIYGAVRVFGGVAWRTNAKAKEDGEKRILKLFPQDPTIFWDEWKKREGVFEP